MSEVAQLTAAITALANRDVREPRPQHRAERRAAVFKKQLPSPSHHPTSMITLNKETIAEISNALQTESKACDVSLSIVRSDSGGIVHAAKWIGYELALGVGETIADAVSDLNKRLEAKKSERIAELRKLTGETAP